MLPLFSAELNLVSGGLWRSLAVSGGLWRSLCVVQLQQQEMQRLQQQREQQQKLQDQQTRRRQLDQGLRLKMKRLAREQQDELQLDMNILQTLLKQEADEKQEAAQRKVNTPEAVRIIVSCELKH